MNSALAGPASAKRIVIIQGHPDPAGNRLGHALANAYAKGARNAGHQVTLIDIAHLEIPFVRTQQEYDHDAIPAGLRESRQAIFAADHIAIFFPLWLGTMPALLKAYLEQVIRAEPVPADQQPNLAELQTRLKGKSARVVVTLGMPAFIFRWYFGGHGVRCVTRGILEICGVRPARYTLLGQVATVSPAKRTQWIAALQQLGANAH
jgi:putative NADPH-quinone reductase